MPIGMQPSSGNRGVKYIVNPWTGPIDCCWSDCWNRALDIWSIRMHEHARSIPCNSPFAQHAVYTFCSQSHADYWAASSGWRAHDTADRHRGRIWGNHSAGMRNGR